MYKTIKGCAVTKRKGLNHWEILLKNWAITIENYCKEIDEDAPYIYTERANIGILAAAAFRSKWIALEEFQSEKGFRNKSKRNGRADLFLSSNRGEEFIESKFKWISLRGKLNDFVEKSSDVLQDALEDAKKTNRSDGDATKVGVAFISVYLKKKDSKNLENKINQIIGMLQKIDCHAYAWIFPKETRTFESEKLNLMPGIIILAKNVCLK